MDPFGIYMAGFTLGRSPTDARQAAQAQRTLAQQAGDQDGVGWWEQVLAFLTLTDPEEVR
jgi:hypothetical protein